MRIKNNGSPRQTMFQDFIEEIFQQEVAQYKEFFTHYCPSFDRINDENNGVPYIYSERNLTYYFCSSYASKLSGKTFVWQELPIKSIDSSKRDNYHNRIDSCIVDKEHKSILFIEAKRIADIGGYEDGLKKKDIPRLYNLRYKRIVCNEKGRYIYPKNDLFYISNIFARNLKDEGIEKAFGLVLVDFWKWEQKKRVNETKSIKRFYNDFENNIARRKFDFIGSSESSQKGDYYLNYHLFELPHFF